MQPETAIELIRCSCTTRPNKAVWADLGCGTGTFTNALAQLLQPGSRLYGVDTDSNALNRIKSVINDVAIEKLHADFALDQLPLSALDGILMANAIHFVKEKPALIAHLRSYMKPEACFVLVEYDMDTPNPWVPYPLSFVSLQRLFRHAGYSTISKLNETSSVYQRAQIYSALIMP